MIILKILVFLIILSVIIIIHEFGHFYFARRAGVLCHEFSLGMGPVIYQKKKGETTYSIRAIPIGGFVSMAGEQVTADMIKPNDFIGINLSNGCVSELVLSDKKTADIRGKVIRIDLYGRHGEPLEVELELEDSTTKTYPVLRDAFYVFDKSSLQIAPYDRSFESKSLWQRFLSIFFGPFMNFVLAMIIYLLVFFIQGTPKYDTTMIGEIDSNYPAYGILQEGDVIEEVNGVSVSNWDEFTTRMKELAYQGTIEVNVKVKGSSETKVINNYVAINSIGLSNINVKELENIPSELKGPNGEILGAQVGKVGLRYTDKVSSDDTQLTNGDIITYMMVLPRGTSYDEALWQNVTSWSTIINNLKDQDIAKVYFKYYDHETGENYNTYDRNQTIETYGNNVLTNQGIEKIKIYLGVSPTYHHNFFESVGAACKEFWSDFTLIFKTLKLLIAPGDVRQIGVDDLSGVIGIFSMVSAQFSAGILALLLFMALLSVNIGVMNLLPIPALDGGRLVFLAIEGITRKPLNRKIEATINNIMFILLMIFMVYIAYNDIMKLIFK
ncbi:MAG: RIP metalloprotease RseP [Anaeroplasmataceae bacterium]